MRILWTMGAEFLQINVSFTVPDHDALKQARPATAGDLYPDDVARSLRDAVRAAVERWESEHPGLLACPADVG